MSDIIATINSTDDPLNAGVGGDSSLTGTITDPSESGGGGADLEWTTVTSSATLTPNRAYAVNAASLILLSLPNEALSGQRLAVYNLGTGGWRLQQNSGQRIKIGDKMTTTGQTGRVDAIATGDYLELVFLPPLWVCTDIIGNLEVV
ncbi:MAG: hypothetical protein KME30_24950 [Iphinoe sp. HA4291-MV1]|jgi:hypothetical protein|nr:hypothetical protein [Iphinoe sp. HA4291-MV1]